MLHHGILTTLALCLATSSTGEISTAMNVFGLQLMQYTSRTENVMISPYSICTAFAMLNTGTGGETKTQIDTAFGWTETGTVEQYKALINNIDMKSGTFTLKSSNRLYIDNNFPAKQSFITGLDSNFGADTEEVNFSEGDNTDTVVQINGWVAAQTNDKIKPLLTKIAKSVRAILINTIYFKANWLLPFSATGTEKSIFYVDKEYAVNADTMKLEEELAYYENDDVEMIKLEYDSGEATSRKLSMLVIKPKSRGELEAVERDLIEYEFSQISTWMSALQYENIRLSMPKFEYKASFPDLKKILQQQFGVTDVFDGNADLSGITENSGLYVSEVIHEAFISVDENGTEAAAATAIIIDESAAIISEPRIVLINQPFLFLIYDETNNAVLFVGRVLVPNTELLAMKFVENNYNSSALLMPSIFVQVVSILVTTFALLQNMLY